MIKVIVRDILFTENNHIKKLEVYWYLNTENFLFEKENKGVLNDNINKNTKRRNGKRIR